MTVRELNGWAPASVTYSPAGEVLSVTVTEPRFTPEEKFLLLASRREDMRPRGGHGLLLSEATDPANADAYTVPLPLTDFAEKALSNAKKKYRDRWGADALDNLLWRVERKS